MERLRRTITKETPVTVTEVKEFADSFNIGDTITSRLPIIKVWTSTSNFNLKHKTVKVTILKKYPHHVGTDYGVFTWKELILGFYDSDFAEDEAADEMTDETDIEAVSKSKKGKTTKKAA